MICPFGRGYNPDHASCRSCQQQGIGCKQKKARKVRAAGTAGPVIIDGRKAWVVFGQDTPSLNDWTGKHNSHRIYAGIKGVWRKMTKNAAYHFGQAKGRRGIHVRRYVSSKGHLMDRDNFWGGLKPLVDCLKEQGIFIDDSPRWLEWLEIEQGIGQPRVEIFVEHL